MSDLIQLSNGVEMPKLGMGTFPLRGSILMDAVDAAHCEGYSLFDTADNYYNEPDLGEALQNLYTKYSVQRETLFLVSKLSDELYEPGTLGGGANKGVYFWKNSPLMQAPNAVHKVVLEKFEKSLKSLRTDYLDLLLMHWPYPDFFEEIWYEMELLYKQGRVRAIGVCNCRERHLEKLRNNCSVFPMVNQFETCPVNTKQSLVDYCNQNKVQVMVYSPLKSLSYKNCFAYQDFLQSLAKKYNKGIGQIVLRFDIQRGLIPIPKSMHRNRLHDNMNVFDFVLDDDDMKTLYSFNENRAYLPESKACPGY
ncbi:MAG: aldo/keto reductase [Fibrobacter sp.]|nr:aldo/keto reductase [Fibrobacter sp.]